MANEVARQLRKRMMPQDVRVCEHLRVLRLQGLHVRRQVPIGRFIVDFACLRAKLVVEIDGAQHGMPAHRRHDELRDRELSAKGYKTLRFWNVEVEQSWRSVFDTIVDEAVTRLG